MKILNVAIQGIRSYMNAEISLSPFLNIFMGDSDAGKSAFVKALMFVIRNFSTKKTISNNYDGESFVEISDGIKTVKRARDGSGNFYSIKIGKEEKNFTAIGKQIPFDVQKALNLSDSNIQQQREAYFLIDKSAGLVSKELNKISGLSDIDTTIKLISAEINSINSSIRENNNRIAEDKESIKGTEWVIGADKELTLLETIETEIQSLDKFIDNLETLLRKYSEIQNKKSALLPSDIVEEYKGLALIEEEIKQYNSTCERLKYFLESYEKTKNIYDTLEVIDPTPLQAIYQEIADLESGIKLLEVHLKSYTSINTLISVLDEKIAKTENELSKIKVCPTCKRPI
jgi:DNA repair protein SbcC/Rad50